MTEWTLVLLNSWLGCDLGVIRRGRAEDVPNYATSCTSVLSFWSDRNGWEKGERYGKQMNHKDKRHNRKKYYAKNDIVGSSPWP